MTLSYLTGLIVSRRITIGSIAVFIALALLINAKQSFVLWMRRREGNPARSLVVFLAQILVATIICFPHLGNDFFSLMPYMLVPVLYLLCLKFLGEHAILTEISGFVVLSLSALIAKFTVTEVIDPVLFTVAAVFFTAGVFKVRVQFTKALYYRVLTGIYLAFALIVYWLMDASLLLLLPLIDNLVFALVLYRTKLSVTGWLEVLKGTAFILLMALTYQ